MFNIVKTANLKRFKSFEKLLEKSKEELAYYKRSLSEERKLNREFLLQIDDLKREIAHLTNKKNLIINQTDHQCQPLDSWTGPSGFNPPCKICGRVIY